MTFRFGFLEDAHTTPSVPSPRAVPSNATNFETLTVKLEIPRNVQYETESVQITGSRTLVRRKANELTAKYFGNIENNRDIIGGVYEGGFKLWEGSVDLVLFLFKNLDLSLYKTGIELGCGHGLPGIFSLQEGINMDFLDYNREVIREVLFPNLLLNNCLEAASDSLFFAGDWTCLLHQGLCERYDLILGSEIMYRTETFHTLTECLQHLLKVETGVAYLSGKRFYFGVGGGTEAFRRFLESQMPEFKCNCVMRTQDGKSNVREILEIRKRPSC
eukprot:jgi/Galph1/3099/GphlegSOOS_G1793.1